MEVNKIGLTDECNSVHILCGSYRYGWWKASHT